MKKAAAILLLAIFAFNIFGYRLLYNYLSHKADTTLELALDEQQYDDADLISIKQPTNLPYYTNSKNFQRIDGEVNVEGTIYKYVKYRIYNDSLEMLCIPNLGKMKIQNAKDEFFKLANDFQQAGNKKKNHSESKQLKSIVTEFEALQDAAELNPAVPPKEFHSRLISMKQKEFIFSTEQPPDTFIAA
jgi:hypothetical protein